MKNLAQMLVALDQIELCLDPTCGDSGATRHRRASNVEPEQCQFCYSPHSKYQFKQDLIQLFDLIERRTIGAKARARIQVIMDNQTIRIGNATAWSERECDLIDEIAFLLDVIQPEMEVVEMPDRATMLDDSYSEHQHDSRTLEDALAHAERLRKSDAGPLNVPWPLDVMILADEVKRLRIERNDFKTDLMESALYKIRRGGHSENHAGNFWGPCPGCIAENTLNHVATFSNDKATAAAKDRRFPPFYDTPTRGGS